MRRYPLNSTQWWVVDITDLLTWAQEKMSTDLMREFDARIAGQQEAKKAIIETLLTGIYALRRDGALGAVFLGGPTGVGKTELVKTLASILFGNGNGFTGIQWELLKHPTDVAILHGAPPWYIGYDDTPRLATSRLYAPYRAAKDHNKLHSLITDNQYNTIDLSIVLVDEAEKAHPEVLTAFLGALQNGNIEMNSAWGGKNWHEKITNLSNTLFIFTSNIGEHIIAAEKNSTIGFIGSEKDDSNHSRIWQKNLEKQLPPEFLGRMNRIIRCHSLTDDMANSIMNISLAKINNSLSAYYDGNFTIGMSTEYTKVVLKKLASESQKSWGRPIVRYMETIAEKVGFAIHHKEKILGRWFNWGKMLFDIWANGSPSIALLTTTSKSQILSLLPPSSRGDHLKEMIDGVMWENRKLVDTYMRLISNYDTYFHDPVSDIEKRLQDKLWFNSDQLQAIRMAQFLKMHDAIDGPTSIDEDVTENVGTFHGFSIKFIKSLIKWFVRQEAPVGMMYEQISGFMWRLLVPEEIQFIGYYIQREIMKKNARTKKYPQ